MGKLTLKNLKFHEDMSEETPCFSADVYEDGKLIAHVKNSGRGGCNDVYPAEGIKHKDIAFLHDMETDCEIMQMAEDLNFTKKNQSKGFVLKKKDEPENFNRWTSKFPMPISKLKKHKDYAVWLKKQLVNLEKDGYEVMNTNL